MSNPIPAVGVICFKGDQVLLIRRGKPPREGEWSLPGGRVEPGESFEQCALRELLEETNVRAKLLKKVAEIDGNFGTHHYMLHDYLAEWESGDVRAGDDAAEAKWVAMSSLSEISMWSKTHQVIKDSWDIYQSLNG